MSNICFPFTLTITLPMKIAEPKPRFPLTLLLASLAAGVLLVITGCASMDASNQESLLVAAGFRARTPQTPKQHELYDAAPAYKVEHASLNGKSFYAYKYESKGVAYIGGEAEYQRYKQLAIAQRIARDYYTAAEMNRQAAWGWYGAYGYRTMGW